MITRRAGSMCSCIGSVVGPGSSTIGNSYPIQAIDMSSSNINVILFIISRDQFC